MKNAMKWIIGLLVLMVIGLSSCENYSKGDRVGYITKFSEKGAVNNTFEGELSMSQTGENSAGVFSFSLDDDDIPYGLVATIDSALQNGWKVRLRYHQVAYKNWFKNRGETDYFVTECVVVKKPIEAIVKDKQTTESPKLD